MSCQVCGAPGHRYDETVAWAKEGETDSLYETMMIRSAHINGAIDGYRQEVQGKLGVDAEWCAAHEQYEWECKYCGWVNPVDEISCTDCGKLR